MQVIAVLSQASPWPSVPKGTHECVSNFKGAAVLVGAAVSLESEASLASAQWAVSCRKASATLWPCETVAAGSLL